MSTVKDKPKADTNGKPPDPLAEAVLYEQGIADEALTIRGDKTELDPALFLELWPLLRRPIPRGFIESTDAVKGKPYQSTGVRSMQVQVDRMNNVLTPLWWSWETFWHGEGKRCIVEVVVGAIGQQPLLVRRSPGGVNQASTVGNLYKGSETNAAKRAFAAVGPGHEVYLGATDFDPDTDPDAAKAQENTSSDTVADVLIPPDKAENLAAIIESAGLKDHLAAKLRSFGKKEITELTLEQGMTLYEWSRDPGEASDGA